jgi:hypothetical protein
MPLWPILGLQVRDDDSCCRWTQPDTTINRNVSSDGTEPIERYYAAYGTPRSMSAEAYSSR